MSLHNFQWKSQMTAKLQSFNQIYQGSNTNIKPIIRTNKAKKKVNKNIHKLPMTQA